MLRIEQIHEALFDEGSFKALPQALAEAVGARSSIIHWVHSDGEISVAAHSYFSDKYMQAYKQQYVHKDLWVLAAQHPARRNQIFKPSEAVPASVWERSEIWNDFVQPAGDDTFFCVGGAFDSPWGAGMIGLNRGKSSGDFHDQATAKLSAYSDALRRVLMLRGEILAHKREADLARAGLDALDAPAITLRSDGFILSFNRAAETVLRRADGLINRRGCLHAREDNADRRLAAALAAATSPERARISAFLVPRFAQDQPLEPYQLTVAPIPVLSGPRRAMALFRDPGARDQTLADRLQMLYRLTAAETELAIKLAEGERLSRIAEIRGVTEATLRSQLKPVMAKLMCNRQAEVAALVARLLPISPSEPSAAG